MDVIKYSSIEKCSDIIKEFQSKENINIFFTYEWLNLWKKYFAPNHKELILVFKENGETVGFAPMIYTETPILKIKIYRFYGTRKSNYISLPTKPGYKKKLYDQTFRILSSNKFGALLRIDDINNSSEDYKILIDYRNQKSFYQYSCPLTNLNTNWDDFLNSHYKKKKRKELISFSNKLERVGNVQLFRIKDEASFSKYKNLIEETFYIHDLRFKKVINSSKYSDKKYTDFYRKLIAEFSYKNIIDLSLLCIDGRVVSFLLAFRQGDMLIDYIPGFNITFQKYSLGHLHLMKLFEDLIAEANIKYFDFSKGTGIYKEKWADESTENYSFLFSFGYNPIVLVTKLVINSFTALKLYSRKRQWNSKIKSLLGKFQKKDSDQENNEVRIEECNINELEKTSEKEYKYNLLVKTSLTVQKFVLDKLYYGYRVCFIFKEEEIGGIKVFNDYEERYFKIT